MINAFKRNTGTLIHFGKYKQGPEEDCSKTPIEWIILDKEHGRTLLLSKYVLEI